jgi:nitrogen fixation/metabolism regulation signal transduction histidine kinase
MDFRSRFVLGLTWRVALLLLAIFCFVYTLHTEGLAAARFIAAAMCAGAVAALWRHVQQANLELVRFVDAVRFGDLSQSFSKTSHGSGFTEFGEALDQGIRRLREERHRLSDASRFYEAVLDDAPTAILTIDAEGKVELTNKAARKLLTRHDGVRIEDFKAYGEDFARSLEECAIGWPRLVPLVIDNVPQTATVSAAAVHRLDGAIKVVSVQPIQRELNAVEIAAQSDLIRVLTHEIMNSITPVTSLAHSAAALMSEIDNGKDRTIADARAAVETLSRRADGLMHFVESYRQISRIPEVRRRRFEVLAWARDIEALFRASVSSAGIDFFMEVSPPDLVLEADPDLLCQVVINLLRNATDAASGHSDLPTVSLSVCLAPGGGVQIEVTDNGPGIPEALSREIFLPFFTTKEKGTGVGLSLARQIVLAQGGSITSGKSKSGGALLQIIL